jgi:hypothetical protein
MQENEKETKKSFNDMPSNVIDSAVNKIAGLLALDKVKSKALLAIMVDITYQYSEMCDSEDEGSENAVSEEEVPAPTQSDSPYKLKNPMM